MKLLIYIMLVVMILTGLSSGYDIQLTKNRVVSADAIMRMVDSLPTTTVDTIKILDLEIRRYIERKGYFDAILRVNMTATGINVMIASGPRFRLNSFIVNYQGDSLDLLGEQLEQKFMGHYATEKNILVCLDEILEIYSDNGYPFAQSKLLSMSQVDGDKVNLSLEITSGPIVIIDSLQFNSDKRISTDFLQRKTGIETGEPFNQKRIEKSLKNINSLRYLQAVNPPDERYSGNFSNCALIYNIRHIGSNRIEGALGYNPKSTGNNGYLYGYIDMALYNPLGDGKSFFLKWNKPGVSNSRLNLSFEYPYVLGASWDAMLDIGQERFSDYYLSLRTGLTMSSTVSPQYNYYVNIRWNRIDAQGESFRSVFNSRVYEAGIGLNLSSFDDIGFDNFGKSINIQLTYLHKRLYPTMGIAPERNSFNPFKTDIGLRLATRLFGVLFTDLRARFEGFSEDESLISAAEMVKLGGRKTIRGYSEEQFITPRAFWMNLEFGIYQESSLKSYLFADMGYARLANIYAERLIPRFDNEFLFGAGFGFKLFSGQTSLDLNVGWSKDDSLGEGKLYLILENRF